MAKFEIVVDYMVVSATDKADLVSDVKTALVAGWQPLGGVSVTSAEQPDAREYEDRHYCVYAQAMVKIYG